MFRNFHEPWKFVRSLNSYVPSHDPEKNGGAKDFKDFRPINMIGSLYKLLAKVLANRLKGVMCKVVNNGQNAFVRGDIFRFFYSK